MAQLDETRHLWGVGGAGVEAATIGGVCLIEGSVVAVVGEVHVGY